MGIAPLDCSGTAQEIAAISLICNSISVCRQPPLELDRSQQWSGALRQNITVLVVPIEGNAMLSLNDPVHAYAIEALADEMRLSVEHVAEVYVVEWKRLAADARIDDYLPVLTAKAVKEALRVQRTELVAA